MPLSSLDPAPAKNPSSAERKATLPEQELQQLEMGTGSHGYGPRVPGRRPGPPPGPVHLPPEVHSCSPSGQTPRQAIRSRLTAILYVSLQNYF